LSVDVLNETSAQVEEREFMALGRFVLDAMGVHPGADLVITLVDTRTMSELHERFLDEPGPTDVLSFPMDELRPKTAGLPGPPGVLGDVVICPEVAAKQAREYGHTATEEMLVLAVHGILHLLGFDHAEAAERTAMNQLQRKLMLAFLASR
jgi:probable rRNA maturation factor